MSNIPRAREAIANLAKMARWRRISHTEMADALEAVLPLLHRRERARQARQQSRRMTPGLRRNIWEYGRTHPDMPIQDIAVKFGVNAARVSETLNPEGDWESTFAEEILDETLQKARAA